MVSKQQGFSQIGLIVFILVVIAGIYFIVGKPLVTSPQSNLSSQQVEEEPKQYWESFEADPIFGGAGYTSGPLQYGKKTYQVRVIPSDLEKIYTQDFPCQEQKIMEGYKGRFEMQLQEGTDQIIIERDENGRVTTINDTRVLNLDHKFIKIDELDLGERELFGETEQSGMFSSLLPVSLNPVVEIVALAERVDCYNTKLTVYGIDPNEEKLTIYKFKRADGQIKDHVFIPKGVNIPQRDSKFRIIEDYYEADRKIRIKIPYRFDANQNIFIEVEH